MSSFSTHFGQAVARRYGNGIAKTAKREVRSVQSDLSRAILAHSPIRWAQPSLWSARGRPVLRDGKGKSEMKHLLRKYEAKHQNPTNRAIHRIGVPLIVLSIPALFFSRPLGFGMLGLGWLLQILGHRIEGNKPAFMQNPIFLLVGPVWVFRTIRRLLAGKRDPSGT